MDLFFRSLKRINLEAAVWISGLLILAFITPATDTHITICPFKNLGLPFCPGCGLGCSISFLFHGNIRQSLECHVLGIPALLILTYRIFTLLKISPEINFKSLSTKIKGIIYG